MARLEDRLKNAQARAEIARLNKETAVNKMQLATIKKVNRNIKTFQAEYDALDPNQSKKRRQSRIETKSPDDQVGINKRLKGAALGRNLHENAATFKGYMHQFKVNVVGAQGPKLRLNSEDEGAKEAANWFNGTYAKHCDGNDDAPLAEQIAMAVMALKREGDVLCVFDDFLRDDGRLLWFESDQLVTIEPKLWEPIAKDRNLMQVDPRDASKQIPLTVKNGVILDTWGRVMGWIVSPEHGKIRIDPAHDLFSIIMRFDPEFNPTGSAKLFKAPWRFNQYRGEGDALTVANGQQDIYEMIAAELQSAKKACQLAGWTEVDKDADGAISGAVRAMQKGGMTEAEINAVLNGDGTDSGSVSTNYDAMEGLTGGLWEYTMPGEKLHIHDPNRPEMDVANFAEWLMVADGGALGLSRVHSTHKAATSYTAFRGEQLMSWDTFEWDQKSAERRLMDFIGFKALQYGQRKGKIKKLADGWVDTMSWVWKKMREVDETKSTTAVRNKLKNGQMNFEDMLGTNWKDILTKTAEQTDFIRENDLPLSILESITGTELSSVDEVDENGEPIPTGEDGEEVEGEGEQVKQGEKWWI